MNSALGRYQVQVRDALLHMLLSKATLNPNQFNIVTLSVCQSCLSLCDYVVTPCQAMGYRPIGPLYQTDLNKPYDRLPFFQLSFDV